MSLKNNWQTKKLGEICEEIITGDWGKGEKYQNLIPCKVIRGTDFPSVQKGDFSSVPIRYVSSKKIKELKLNKGDILLEISGGSKDQPTGRILFWDKDTQFPVIFSNFVRKLKLNTKEIEPKYFFRYWQFLYLKGKTKDYEERTTNIRNFKFKYFLENEEIPLPPLSVQEKIVKILDAIQEAVDIQEKIIEKTKELKKSMMANLFKYGGPSFRKGRKLKKTEIGEIPEDWEVVMLREALKSLESGDRPKGGKLVHNPLGVLSIGAENINWDGCLELKDCLRFDKNFYCSLKKGKIEENDILLVKDGATIGKLAYIEKIPEGMAMVNEHVFLLKTEITKFNPKFLFYFLSSKVGQQQIKTSISGSAQGGINKSILDNILIFAPPLSEQQEIAEILQTIDQKIEIEKRKKELYEELFKTMLNKIMNQEIDIEKVEI